MPVSLTYPGVYIEEISSGVRTITGVSTSITAFIGRALRGPVNQAVTINSLGDYNRIFGGLWLDSSMSYAVRDFFLNGGGQAVIVRLFQPGISEEAQNNAEAAAKAVADAATGAGAAEAAANARTKAGTYTKEPEKSATDRVATAAEAAAVAMGADAASVKKVATDAAKEEEQNVMPSSIAKLEVGGLSLEAANEGKWGENLKAEIDKKGITDDIAKQFGLKKDDLFNLTVTDSASGGVTERYINLSVKESSRQVGRVLEKESQLVRCCELPPINTVIQAGKSEQKVVVSDGERLTINNFTSAPDKKEGLYALEQIGLFNLLCIPPYTENGDIDSDLVDVAATYCEKRRAMFLVDPPSSWTDKTKAKEGAEKGVGTLSRNAAIYFPRVKQANPLRENHIETFVPCGVVAGLFARTDAQRGVWKAPAGIEATLKGVQELSVNLTDAENGELYPLGVNCLRNLPVTGRVCWGARTLRGADQLADEYKYVPVRRLALFIEESLYRGTQWVVFEPNDEPLWAQIRLNVGAFMHNLFRRGAFQGSTPEAAYFVKCDKDTTTQNDINLGIVNIQVGFAPLKPAEFVVIKIQQISGDIEV